MLFRLLGRSFGRRWRRAGLAILAISVGASLASALASVSMDISEKLGKELRAFGANIMVTPRNQGIEVEVAGMRYSAHTGEYLKEADLPKLKAIFWRHNIVAFSPFLSGVVEVGKGQALLVGTWFDREVELPSGKMSWALPGGRGREARLEGGKFITGIRDVAPWWGVQGEWISGEKAQSSILVGSAMAKRMGLRVGEKLTLKYGGKPYTFRVLGILSTGGFEEEQLFVDLSSAQAIFNLPGKVEKVQVSALVKPDDGLANRAKGDPRRLPPAEYEKWYCSPYIDAITFQIEEAIPKSRARPIRQVAEAEGAFLKKVHLFFILVTGIALAASATAVMAAMTASVFERRREIGLMKAIGADGYHISRQFLLEGATYGLLGGGVGYLLGWALAHLIGTRVFGVAISASPALLPFILLLSLGVALLGSAFPVRRAIQVDPIITLRGD